MAFPFYSNTIYKYFTPDGGPPSAGAPPKAPGPPPGRAPPAVGFPFPPGPPPAMSYMPGGPQPMICFPGGAPPPAPPPSCCPPPGPPPFCAPGGPPPGGSYVWIPNGTAPPPSPPAPAPVAGPPPPPPPVAPSQYAPPAPAYRDPPPPGSRVSGRLLTFPEGQLVYCAPEKHCVFHVIQNGIKPWQTGQEYRDSEVRFIAVIAPTLMTVGEFIRQLGALGKCPPGTPWSHIGITEVFRGANGAWTKGTTILQGDARVGQTLEAMGWQPTRGEAGQYPPVVLAFEP